MAGKTTAQTPAFDPGRHVTSLKGSDYLEVKWRLVWLRDAHPDAILETELYAMDPNYAVFKAHIQIPDGGSATGWGSEERKDFKDYIEKAETKAIGRALAALGFGTQFANDFADADTGRLADAPVQRQTRPAPVPHTDIDGPALREAIVTESKANEDTPERRQKGLAAVFAAGNARSLKSDDVKRLAYKRCNVTTMKDIPAPRLSMLWKYLNDADQETLIADLAAATIAHPEVKE